MDNDYYFIETQILFNDKPIVAYRGPIYGTEEPNIDMDSDGPRGNVKYKKYLLSPFPLHYRLGGDLSISLAKPKEQKGVFTVEFRLKKGTQPLKQFLDNHKERFSWWQGDLEKSKSDWTRFVGKDQGDDTLFVGVSFGGSDDYFEFFRDVSGSWNSLGKNKPATQFLPEYVKGLKYGELTEKKSIKFSETIETGKMKVFAHIIHMKPSAKDLTRDGNSELKMYFTF